MKHQIVVLIVVSLGWGCGTLPGFRNPAVEVLKIMGQTQVEMSKISAEKETKQTEALVRAVIASEARPQPQEVDVIRVPADYEACRVPPPVMRASIARDPCAGDGIRSLGCAAARAKEGR